MLKDCIRVSIFQNILKYNELELAIQFGVSLSMIFGIFVVFEGHEGEKRNCRKRFIFK